MDKSLYQDKAKLKSGLSTMSARDLANEIGVSVKLINVWGLKYDLIRSTPEMKLP
jgi:hypothetical protein